MLPRMQSAVWEANYKIVDALSKLSEKKGCTNSQLALSWIMHQGAARGGVIIPIPGVRLLLSPSFPSSSSFSHYLSRFLFRMYLKLTLNIITRSFYVDKIPKILNRKLRS